MKKILSLALSFAMLAGVASVLPVNQKSVKVNAESQAIEITPFAHYEFLDEENPGKDSSNNNFDLIPYVTSSNPEAMQIKQDESGENYLQLVSDRNSEGTNLGTGACLVAPELGSSGKDFSDLITGSFSVSFTFRRDNTNNKGDHYCLATGRYNSNFQITPWNSKIEVQLENHMFAPGETVDEKQDYMMSSAALVYIPQVTTEWTNVIVTEDADTNMAYVYVNGVKMVEREVMGVKMTRDDIKYAFTLGAQSESMGTTPNATVGWATVDIKECRVYDSALTASNVAQLCAGEEATLADGTEYIASVEELKAEDFDLLATDVNTIDVIAKQVLPQEVKVQLGVAGIKQNAKVTWYPVKEDGVDKIKGYIHSSYARTAGMYSFDYGYTIRIDYDPNMVAVTQIKLNNMAYTPGTPISANKQFLTFKVRPLAEAGEVSVNYLEMAWPLYDEEENIYMIEVTKGAHVYVEVEIPSATVTYFDGSEELGTSKYTYGGSEELFTPEEKEGYVFVGWFTDEECTKEFTGLDYNNPVNITLYAKYKEEGGCKSSVAGSTLGLIGLALAGVVIGKKRR